MLGNNEIAIEKLNEAEKALENEKNKNKELASKIEDTAKQINKQKKSLKRL